jgi:hypothetical protein
MAVATSEANAQRMAAITLGITIHPLDHTDRGVLADAFAHLSEDSRRRRRFGGLAKRARAEGITRLLAHIGTDNVRVIDWARRSGGVVKRRDGDAVLMAIKLA